MDQFNGLVDGYNAKADPSKKLPYLAFQILNDVGDFLDLLNALEPSRRPDYDKMTPEEVFRTVSSNGRCSALVKLNGDMSDLWSAHSAWFVYSATNRYYNCTSFSFFFLKLNLFFFKYF